MRGDHVACGRTRKGGKRKGAGQSESEAKELEEIEVEVEEILEVTEEVLLEE